jgi:hypothetical protein
MNLRDLFVFSGGPTQRARCLLFFFVLTFVPPLAGAGEAAADPLPKGLRPFSPGEKLVYNLSWSNIISAGTAVMEVRKERPAADGEVVRFVSTARSIGLVDKFYPVRDVVQSVFDLSTRESLSYTMDQSHGKRKKLRELIFDHGRRKVTVRESGAEAVFDIPKQTQDALSSLYYVRLSDELVIGKTVTVNVNDNGKNWSVEIYVLAKEKIKTPAGEFNTVKVKTYPKYEGVFMHKGEIFIWFTDDERKVPVLMKSTITIGSIMGTLTEMRLGGGGE